MTDRLFDIVNSQMLALAAASPDAGKLGTAQLNCDRHGPYMAKGTRLRTRDVWTNCPTCGQEKEAQEKAKREEARRLADLELRERQLLTAHVPTRFIGRTLATFKAELPEQERALRTAQEFVSNWSEVRRKGSWLVFSGLPGTGKSHLAIAILQALMPTHVGRYLTCMELIQLIRSTWRKDSDQSETDVLDKLASMPLLVIDEVGVQYGTDSEQNHLFDVLDRRYRDLMPTILLTNQNKEGFRAFVGDRVYDRMTECAKWVPFTWPSHRPQARREMQEV